MSPKTIFALLVTSTLKTWYLDLGKWRLNELAIKISAGDGVLRFRRTKTDLEIALGIRYNERYGFVNALLTLSLDKLDTVGQGCRTSGEHAIKLFSIPWKITIVISKI
jgi:hypothetical protein